MRREASRKIHVDFGEVETGGAAVKWLEIVNESCVSVPDSLSTSESDFDQVSIESRQCT